MTSEPLYDENDYN